MNQSEPQFDSRRAAAISRAKRIGTYRKIDRSLQYPHAEDKDNALFKEVRSLKLQLKFAWGIISALVAMVSALTAMLNHV